MTWPVGARSARLCSPADKKDVILTGGYTVYPPEIEAALEEHPDVAEAAVVGLTDDRDGEVPVAVVRAVAGHEVDTDELVAWAADRLAGYKAPRRVVVAETLPRTGTRKVKRRELLPLFD